MRTVRANRFEAVDQLVNRVAGMAPGRVELVLEANRDLANPERLAEGQAVIIPDFPASAPTAPMIQLWT